MAGDQQRGRRPGSARSRALFSVLAIVLIAATALAATAGAASKPRSDAAYFPGSELLKKKPKNPRIPKKDITRLRKANCPAPYLVRVDRDYSEDEIRDARNYRFDIAGQDVTLRPPINWRFDPLGSASFRARLHDLRWLDILLYDYRHNHNRASLKKAKRVVVDWIKSNPRSAPTTDRTWFDKVVGERASYIAYVTRAAACAGMVNGKLPQKLLGSVLTHGRFLLSKSNYTHTNRGLFEDYGLLQVGKQVPWLQGAGKWRRRGEQRFAHTVKQLTYADEGLWLEHSTTYHFLAEGIIEAYLKTPGVKQPAIRALLPKMKAAAGWLIEPDNHWLQAGNSYQDGAGTEARAAAKKTRGLGWFPRSGMAFVRTGNTYLAVLSDFHSSTHKHSDELSFDLYDLSLIHI